MAGDSKRRALAFRFAVRNCMQICIRPESENNFNTLKRIATAQWRLAIKKRVWPQNSSEFEEHIWIHMWQLPGRHQEKKKEKRHNHFRSFN